MVTAIEFDAPDRITYRLKDDDRPQYLSFSSLKSP